MARNTDESQGQNADPETHASGIHSINDLDAGLVENDEERKEKGGEDEEGSDHAYEKPDEKSVCDERIFMEERAAGSPYWQTRTLLKTLVCQEGTTGRTSQPLRV